MEPHHVVEARRHGHAIIPGHPVGEEDGVEQRHVRGVGDDAGVEEGVVGQPAIGSHPHALPGRTWPERPVLGRRIDVARVDRPRPRVPVAEPLPPRGHPLGEGGQGLGLGHRRHRELVVEARFPDVERRRQVEDGVTVLDGHDAPGREGAAVADTVDLVEDRDGGVARSEEVGVQRVDGARAHRPAGGDQGLLRDLAAEDALTLLVRAPTPEDVDLDRLEVEQIDEALERAGHRVRRRGGSR